MAKELKEFPNEKKKRRRLTAKDFSHVKNKKITKKNKLVSRKYHNNIYKEGE